MAMALSCGCRRRRGRIPTQRRRCRPMERLAHRTMCQCADGSIGRPTGPKAAPPGRAPLNAPRHTSPPQPAPSGEVKSRCCLACGSALRAGRPRKKKGLPGVTCPRRPRLWGQRTHRIERTNHCGAPNCGAPLDTSHPGAPRRGQRSNSTHSTNAPPPPGDRQGPLARQENVQRLHVREEPDFSQRSCCAKRFATRACATAWRFGYALCRPFCRSPSLLSLAVIWRPWRIRMHRRARAGPARPGHMSVVPRRTAAADALDPPQYKAVASPQSGVHAISR